MSEVARHPVYRVLSALAGLGVVLVAYAWVGRFLLPGDLTALWVPAAALAGEHGAFASGTLLHVVYAASAAATLWLAGTSVHAIVTTGRAPAALLGASTLTAVAGIALAVHQGAAALGAPIMAYYWWGLGIVWIFTNAMSAIAFRRGSTVIARDWALYGVGLAFIPLTALPQVPLWAMLDAMDIHEAALTAVTASFATHYIIAQFCIVELLDDRRRSAGAPAAG